jgi:hypothetical protein
MRRRLSGRNRSRFGFGFNVAALKTFTVDMADMARSMTVADTPVCSCSIDKRGLARVRT